MSNNDLNAVTKMPSKGFFVAIMDDAAAVHSNIDAAVGKALHGLGNAFRREKKEYTFEENARFGRKFDIAVASTIGYTAPMAVGAAAGGAILGGVGARILLDRTLEESAMVSVANMAAVGGAVVSGAVGVIGGIGATTKTFMGGYQDADGAHLHKNLRTMKMSSR